MDEIFDMGPKLDDKRFQGFSFSSLENSIVQNTQD
jgi:hypothetical protein